MRNHRFHETNSLKRRYSFLLLINNTLILVEILSHYLYEVLYYNKNNSINIQILSNMFLPIYLHLTLYLIN